MWLGSLLVFRAVCYEAVYSLLGKRLTADLSPLGIASLAAALAGVLFAPIAVAQGIGFDWSQPTGVIGWRWRSGGRRRWGWDLSCGSGG